jgi:hypothetical protein
MQLTQYYKDEHTREISFPLGGIVSGCIGLRAEKESRAEEESYH